MFGDPNPSSDISDAQPFPSGLGFHRPHTHYKPTPPGPFQPGLIPRHTAYTKLPADVTIDSRFGESLFGLLEAVDEC